MDEVQWDNPLPWLGQHTNNEVWTGTYLGQSFHFFFNQACNPLKYPVCIQFFKINAVQYVSSLKIPSDMFKSATWT